MTKNAYYIYFHKLCGQNGIHSAKNVQCDGGALETIMGEQLKEPYLRLDNSSGFASSTEQFSGVQWTPAACLTHLMFTILVLSVRMGIVSDPIGDRRNPTRLPPISDTNPKSTVSPAFLTHQL